MEKERLDVLLVNRGMVESREKAKAIIMTGNVFVNEQREDKAGQKFPVDVYIEIRGKKLKFVSRGGYKLEKALQVFPIDLTDLTCMDVGASTGGFTDCMLQNGAKRVYSVDVGYGQLAWSLRTDDRVVNLERTNFRHITEEQMPEAIDFASVDVSFISLKHIFPNLHLLLRPCGQAVCLIKPQFEAGRDKVGKKGVVREAATHLEVVERVIGMAIENGFSVLGLEFSPVKGPEGNIEYLLYVEKSEAPAVAPEVDPAALVGRSHEALV